MLSDKLSKSLNRYCQQLKIPGMALIAKKEGKRVYEYYHGYRHLEKKLPVDDKTIFGLASITKSFACLAILQLQDKNKLSVHDRVQQWIPTFRLPRGGKSDEVTLHHLMTHTAGLPGLSAVHQARLSSIERDPHGAYLFNQPDILHKKKISTVDEMIEEIKKSESPLVGEPGKEFNYSNESYALLQKIIEEASEEPFLKYMKENILEPLSMERTTFLTEDLNHLENVTELYAYDRSRERKVFSSPIWWDVGEIYTNGSLKASASDLMNYVEMLRLGGTFNQKELLTPESIRLMTTPKITTPNDIHYGYGLIIDDSLGVKTIGHGGGIKGVSSFMLFVPEHKLSIVVLINIAEAPAENIAYKVMKHLLTITEERRNPSIKPLSIETLEKYEGVYASEEGQKVTIKKTKDSILEMSLEGQPIPLQPLGNHKFLTPEDKKVAFIVKEDRVQGIFRGLRYIQKVD